MIKRLLGTKALYFFAGYLCVIVGAIVSGCTKEQTTKEIPLMGEVEYRITYSGNIRENETFGDLLPYTVFGVYDTSNIKLSVKAPLGFATLDIVLGRNDDFVAVQIDKAKMILDVDGMFNAEQAKDIIKDVNIKAFDELTDIAGYPSKHIKFYPKSVDSTYAYIEVYYSEFPSLKSVDVNSIMNDKIDRKARALGLVTAINVKVDDSNMIMVVSKVKKCSSLQEGVFDRQSDYIETSKEDLLAMYELFSQRYR